VVERVMDIGRRRFLWTLIIGAPLASLPAASQSGFEIDMDELVDDTRNGRVVARGKVEIRYFGEILVADEVIYDRSTRKLAARGHIVLQEADGKVSRTDAMNLTDDLRDAFVSYARRQKIRIDR
jgi:lipopolysaccharide assembly outer membrane protein LptD (OstA)